MESVNICDAKARLSIAADFDEPLRFLTADAALAAYSDLVTLI
jgi:hypothetical protein